MAETRQTFPELLAKGLGVRLRTGVERCFWCGAACDQSFSTGVSDTHGHYTSMFPLSKTEYLSESERTKIMQSGGRFKSFRLPLRMRMIERVVWFASLKEQLSDLRKLLKKVHHLGKKASQGHGVIAGWDVEPIDHDLSWYAPSNSGPVLMRTLPRDMDHPKGLIGYQASFGGCVGPYWQRDFWREIIEPC